MSNPAAVEADTILRPLRVSRPTQGLVGHIRAPGDTALGQRTMALAALAVGPTDITGFSESESTRHLAAALRQLGARVDQPAEHHWRIHGRGIGGLAEPAGVLEAGSSCLVLHLLAGLAAGHPLFTVLAGQVGPVEPLLNALSTTGARITARAGHRPPLAIEGAAEPVPLDLTLPPGPSGLLGAAVLLAALCARGTSRLTGIDDPGMIGLLGLFGAALRQEDSALFLQGQPELAGKALHLPADPLASAALLLAAVLTPGSALTVEEVAPGAPFPTLLRDMGARVEHADTQATAFHTPLRGIDLPAAALPTTQGPLLAIAAACAQGTSRIRGISQLWGEARLDATLRLLAANGAEARQDGDDLILNGHGRPLPGGGHLAIQEEPCIAMSAIVLGLAAEAPVTLESQCGIDAAFLQALGQATGTDPLVRA